MSALAPSTQLPSTARDRIEVGSWQPGEPRRVGLHGTATACRRENYYLSIEGPRRCLRRVAKAPPSLPELALYDAAVHHLTRISHMYMTYGETRRVRET